MIRAKFECLEVTKRHATMWDEQAGTRRSMDYYAYKFQVVSDGSEENKQFFASTPGGSIELDTVRDALFEPGHSYYVDFIDTDDEK